MQQQTLVEKSSNGATLSDDRVYRYSLWRTLDPSLPRVLWVMLNPSTADETKDDLTIKKCVGFAKRWGYGSIEVANLFALRATNPKELAAHHDPVGPMNDAYLEKAISNATIIVAAWGSSVPDGFDKHIHEVTSTLCERFAICLGKTKAGYPRHPSRIGYDTRGEQL